MKNYGSSDRSQARQANEVTGDYLRSFETGDLVDVKEVSKKYRSWKGPCKIVAYKLNPPTKETKPAAHVKIDVGGGKKLERWLIVGDQQIMRKHVPLATARKL